MRNSRCRKVFRNLKRASRKFNVKRFSKKNGLTKFYALAARSGHNNKAVFSALKSASRKVAPYHSVTKRGLRKFFGSAQRKLKNKSCKGVLSALKKASSRARSGRVTRRKLLSFYNKAEKIYGKKSPRHRRKSKRRRH